MPRLSKYQAILKGKDQFDFFMQWAANDAPVTGRAWLPEKAENEGFVAENGRGQWITQYTIKRSNRREKRKWDPWFADQENYMMGLFADVRRNNIQPPDEEGECYMTEYWDYTQSLS